MARCLNVKLTLCRYGVRGLVVGEVGGVLWLFAKGYTHRRWILPFQGWRWYDSSQFYRFLTLFGMTGGSNIFRF